mgnify:CR=1 FL=1
MTDGLVFALLATASVACNYATRSLLPIVSHAVCADVAESCSAAQLVSDSTSAFFAGDLIAQFSAGLLVQRVSGPWLLGLSTVGWTVATLMIPAALQPSASPFGHPTLQLVRGILCGLGFPAAHAVVAAAPAEVRATALGLINSSAGIGSMLANMVIPKLLSQYGWELPFWALGCMSFSVAVALVVLSTTRRVGLMTGPSATAPNQPHSKATSGGAADYWRWLEEPLVRSLVAWMVVAAIAGQTVGGAFLPTLFIERHGVAVADLGWYTGGPPLAQVTCSPRPRFPQPPIPPKLHQLPHRSPIRGGLSCHELFRTLLTPQSI